MSALLLWTLLFAPVPELGSDLICCGGDEVFILSKDERSLRYDKRKWSWRAADSPRIPEESQKWFRSTDDCKPLPESILITSSSGGVGIVRSSDKACLFLANVKNAHSACLLPNYRMVVASSSGGDELVVFQLGDLPSKSTDVLTEAKPVATLPLPGAHGTVWDQKRGRLWALGNDDLLLIEVRDANGVLKLKIEKQWKLPSSGGHDLSAMKDSSKLYVTSNTNVFQFDKTSGKFALDDAVGSDKKVKSITQHPRTGEVIYHRGTSEHWWSDTIRFVGGREDVQLTGQRLYKVRWAIR